MVHINIQHIIIECHHPKIASLTVRNHGLKQHSFHFQPFSSRIVSGDDGAGKPPAVRGGGETEAACTGPSSVPGERMAAGRARQHTAATPAERAEGGHARRGEETPRVHERNEEI